MNPLWEDEPILFIDFETTGLSPEKDAVVELGAVRFEGGEVKGEFGTLVDPGRPIPKVASNIHGISDNDVRGQPTIHEALHLMREKMLHAGAFPAAYSAAFDKAFFFASSPTCSDVAVLNPAQTWLDPLVMVQHLDRDVREKGAHKLEAACKRWSIETDQVHRAVDDCKAAGKLLWAMRGKLPQCSMEELLSRQRRRCKRQQRWHKRFESERFLDA